MGVTMGWSAPAAKARRRVQALLMALLLLMIGFYGLGVQVVSSQGLFIRSFYIPGDLPIDPKSPDWSKATPMVIPLSGDRKSTRLNSSHGYISYAVFCLKKKKQ